MDETERLTVGQRVAARLCVALAPDLDRGTTAEQHTAALLRLVADAIENNYEAELVRVGREMAMAREGAGHGNG